MATGPYTKSETLKGTAIETGYRPDVDWYSRTWMRQPKPYVTPLEFEFLRRSVLSHRSSNPLHYVECWEAPAYDTPNFNQALNKCYADFKDKVIGETSTWGVNLLEMGKTMTMVKDRLVQLTKLALALKHGRWSEAYGISKTVNRDFKDPSNRKNFPKEFGKQWLEYHFGWEPLVKDIGAGVKTLAHSGGSESRVFVSRKSVQDESFFKTTPSPSYRSTISSVKSSFHMQAKVRIDNPNLYMLNSLGLVNPLSVAWELVPFSFVVDWFVPVGNFLSGWSDFLGLQLTQSFTTGKQVVTSRVLDYYTDEITNPSDAVIRQFVLQSVYVKRNPGISGPVIQTKPLKAPSAVRAATQCSLLLQVLRTR